MKPLNNGETYGVHRGKINANFDNLDQDKLEATQVLTKTNTTVFTPTADYHPATKLYADQLRSNWDNVFNPQGITKDIFVRNNHTGLQAATTIEQTVDYRFVSDSQIVIWNNKEDSIGVKGTAFNKSFGTIAGTVAEGNHIHNQYEAANENIQTHVTQVEGNPHNVTKAEVGLDQVNNTSDANKPISTATQTAIDLKQNSSSLQDDIEEIVETGDVSFSKYRFTKAITGNYTVSLDDDMLIVAAVTADIIITLPLRSTLIDKPYQIIEIVPIVANGYKVRIATQGSDLFPFGNTWFDLPFSQKQFAIGLHEHGFNLRRNLSVGIVVHRNAVWGSANFDTPTGVPWDTEAKNNQNQILEWSDIVNPERIYVRTKGSYSIAGGVNLSPQSVQAWEVTAHIYVNGLPVDHMTLTTGGEGNNKASLFGTGLVDLEADDYIEMTLEHSLTAAVNVTSARFSLGIRL